MDVVAVNNKKIKKLRLLTSFLIIALSIILLVHAILSVEPIVILVFLILVVKIIDLVYNLYRIRCKKHKFQL